jgi:tetratricopeptide (TPR) repeat protein
MMVYADKLSSWESLENQAAELDLSDKLPPRWHGCLAEIDGAFRGYSVLMEALLTQDHPAVVAEEFALDPWQVYQNDISFLEGGCREVFVAAAALVNNWDTPPTETEVRESEHEVVQLVDEGRNEDAIAAFQNLVDSQPDLTVSSNTSKMYGLALLRTGEFDQATEVLLGTLENMRPSNEERSLRRLVADLLLASGSVEKARWHYRKLADYFESRKGDDRWVADQLALLGGVDINAREFPLYMEVLKGFISFDGRHVPPGMRVLVDRMEADFRESPLSDQARQMLGQLEDLSREWVAGQLDAVDLLVANDDFVQAKSRLEQMLFDDLPAVVHETVQRSMDILLQAEKKYLEEQKAILDEVLAAQWDKGVLLLDSQKYDEAINVFTGLFDTIYDVPARANIEKAAEASSIEMRRESASIFVKARRENDFERKKELLRESWQLLNDIIVKYPGIALIDKIRQNLELIEDHIETIDPSLLQELKGSGGPANEQLPVDPA